MGFLNCWYNNLFLCCHLVTVCASALLAKEHCGEELTNVRNGEISFSSMLVGGAMRCQWSVSAPPSKKLLIDIKNIYLMSENDSLTVSVDGVEYNLSRECEKCWTNLVGEILRVSFASHDSVNASANELFYDGFSEESNASYSSAFAISYKVFDPANCEAPAHPKNGYHVGSNFSINSQLRYKCNSPYRLAGKEVAVCTTLEDWPVPSWDTDPPTCIIPTCNGQVLNLTAGKGVVVHPGYPGKNVLSDQRCQWTVVAEANRHVTANVTHFGLPVGKIKSKNGKSFLALYDGDRDILLLHLQGQAAPQTVTTTTNKLVIVLRTGNFLNRSNDAGGSYGFVIEYEATCERLAPPENGNFMSRNFSMGSTVAVACNDGYQLKGAPVLRCLSDASWDRPVPSCALKNVVADFNSVGLGTKVANPSIKGIKKSDVPHQQVDIEKEKDSKPTKDGNGRPHPANDSVDDGGATNVFKGSKTSGEKSADVFTITMIALGVAVPALLIIISTSIFLWYRKRYPARMGFGRKFETFENPIYQKRKHQARHAAAANENPAELQRLTRLPSP